MRELCDHWAERYDWRATERAAQRARAAARRDSTGSRSTSSTSARPTRGALPLILTHGWPGSVIEFERAIGPLTDPPAHGGDAADAFDVVVPSLPGYGFSERPARTGWGVERIARAWAALMAALGYHRYGACGSDWGTSVTAALGRHDAAHLAGIQLVPPLAPPDPATRDDLTAAERAALRDLEQAGASGSGYAAVQSTRPQTIGYALVDSPAALCAWIVEKLWAWSDHDGDLEQVGRPRPRARQRDALLAARDRRLGCAPLLGELRRGRGALSRRPPRPGRRAGRLLDLPARGAAGLAAVGGASLPRHPPLGRAATGRALRRARAAGAVRRGAAELLPAPSAEARQRARSGGRGEPGDRVPPRRPGDGAAWSRRSRRPPPSSGIQKRITR